MFKKWDSSFVKHKFPHNPHTVYCSTLASTISIPSRRLWHTRCVPVSTRESVYAFPAQLCTLCREQIRALTWGVSLGVDILFFSPGRASGQIRAWIRGETLSVVRIALSAGFSFSGSENQMTKLASDREISQSENAFFFFLNLCPPENLGLVFTAG